MISIGNAQGQNGKQKLPNVGDYMLNATGFLPPLPPYSAGEVTSLRSKR
jgi:hypothetical protein